MPLKNVLLIFSAVVLLFSCTQKDKNPSPPEKTVPVTEKIKTASTPEKIMASATEILARKQVPVLCYHDIRPFTGRESASMKDYIVPPAAFAEQMKALSDSGFSTVLPQQLYDYLLYGDPIPEKSVMITFDDTDLEQFTIGAAEMKKYNFKGVFFIMTISINRPRYMSTEQIKALSDDGHVIACHTWDHHMVTKYDSADWQKQLVDTRKKLEDITGKPVEYFAYPFGLWNKEAIAEIKKLDYKMAYCLSGKRDSVDPLFTVRRMLVPGTWTTAGMFKAMRSTFK